MPNAFHTVQIRRQLVTAMSCCLQPGCNHPHRVASNDWPVGDGDAEDKCMHRFAAAPEGYICRRMSPSAARCHQSEVVVMFTANPKRRDAAMDHPPFPVAHQLNTELDSLGVPITAQSLPLRLPGQPRILTTQRNAVQGCWKKNSSSGTSKRYRNISGSCQSKTAKASRLCIVKPSRAAPSSSPKTPVCISSGTTAGSS